MLKKTTGSLIAYNRHLQDMKQEQLAHETGLSQSTISDIENDKTSPTVNQLLKISQVLKVNPTALLPQLELPFSEQTISINTSNVVRNTIENLDNYEEENKILKALVEAKNEIIKMKNDIIAKLKKSNFKRGDK